MRARRLGLAVSRLPSLDEGGEALRLAPVAVEDLLLRPSVKIDYRRLENFVEGKSVVVTGGGGSIGVGDLRSRRDVRGFAAAGDREFRAGAACGARSLAAKNGGAEIDGRIADIRDRDRIFRLMAISSRTSCFMPQRSSMCRSSSGTGARGLRPTFSARSTSRMLRWPLARPRW